MALLNGIVFQKVIDGLRDNNCVVSLVTGEILKNFSNASTEINQRLIDLAIASKLSLKI